MHRFTSARLAIEATMLVWGEGITSRPMASCPAPRSVRTNASPRCPELPVTSTFIALEPGCHLPQAVRHHLHDLQGEMRRLLHHEEEALLGDDGELAGRLRGGGG